MAAMFHITQKHTWFFFFMLYFLYINSAVLGDVRMFLLTTPLISVLDVNLF